MSLARVPRRAWLAIGLLAAVMLLVGLQTSAQAKPGVTEFQLYPSRAQLPCLRGPTGTPFVRARVTRGADNDTMALVAKNFTPGLAFDLFTVERTNQDVNGGPHPDFAGSFGLAWYQSDIHVGADGRADVQIQTILLDQIFGFDPDVGLAPTNTFHVGFWFNDPADAVMCGFTGFTPFNGEHRAGPLAFITRPSRATGLGPLCTDPNRTTTPVTCNP